jgi:hypothetical protein
MDDAKSISTPTGANGNLDSDVSGNMVDQKMYRLIIGSLLYVTASRPDVMFSVYMCVRFQASPRESHFKESKENIEVLEAYTKCWIVVFQWCKVDIPIRTMRDAKLKRRSLRAYVNYWEGHLYLGHPRSKIV